MAAYEMPWEFSFPPFFTLQHHEETKKRQISVWADIILKYSKSINNNKLIVSNCISTFSNDSIGRKISTDIISNVISHLQKSGLIYPVDKEGNEWNLCWYTIDEYAEMIHSWASDTGHVNAVCTIYEVSCAKPEFGEIDEEILLKALRKLEERGKCEVFKIDDSYGVKFF